MIPVSLPPRRRADIIEQEAQLDALMEMAEFEEAVDPDERLARLQHMSQMIGRIDEKELESLAQRMFSDEDPRLRGEMCYGLGRLGAVSFKPVLQAIIGKDPNRWVQKEAINALKSLEEQEVPESQAEPKQPLRDPIRRILDEFEQDQQGYEREEASLLEEYEDQFVAFCHGRLVAAGPDRKQVIQKAMEADLTARPYIRQVGRELPSKPSGRR